MHPKTVRIIAALALLLSFCAIIPACGRQRTAMEAPEASAVPETLEQETLPPETEPPTTAPTEPSETVPPETEPREEHFLLTFAGDCTLGCRAVNEYAQSGFIKTVGEDYGYPFRNVLDLFESDDLTVVNLEGPLTDTAHPAQKRFVFRGPTRFAEILPQGSVEAVTLANNHAMDHFEEGYASTKQALDDVGVSYVEQNQAKLITTASGLRVGLYGMVYLDLNVEKMTAGIAELREQGAELVVVLPHWGTEYTYQPTQEQQKVGRAAIDAGANLVVGSHPHVLQSMESYGDGLIFYSLGNFSFGGNGDPGDYDTVILRQEVIRDAQGSISLGETVLVPACVSSVSGRNNFQPTPYAPEDPGYGRVLEKLAGTWSPRK